MNLYDWYQLIESYKQGPVSTTEILSAWTLDTCWGVHGSSDKQHKQSSRTIREGEVTSLPKILRYKVNRSALLYIQHFTHS